MSDLVLIMSREDGPVPALEFGERLTFDVSMSVEEPIECARCGGQVPAGGDLATLARAAKEAEACDVSWSMCLPCARAHQLPLWGGHEEPPADVNDAAAEDPESRARRAKLGAVLQAIRDADPLGASYVAPA